MRGIRKLILARQAAARAAFAIAALCLVLALVAAGQGAMAQAARQGSAPQRKPPARGGERPPAIEQITENTFRVGAALVDTRDRTVSCPGEINMDAGAIEYLAVAPGGKTHESLLRIDVRPLHLQLALLMLDLEPKNVLTQQGERAAPQGDPVELHVRWKDREGRAHDVRAEELILYGAAARPVAKHNWVFTGSRVLKQGFQADLEKSLVAVWHDPAAILDNPHPDGGSNGHIVNTRLTPRRGTRVELLVKAPERPAPAPAANNGAGGRR